MTVLTLMVILALIATFIALAWGVGSMAAGGSYDRDHSEILMFARVGLQAFAFFVLMIALYFSIA